MLHPSCTVLLETLNPAHSLTHVAASLRMKSGLVTAWKFLHKLSCRQTKVCSKGYFWSFSSYRIFWI